MFRVTSRDCAQNWMQTWKYSAERHSMQEELSNIRRLPLNGKYEPSQFSSSYARPFWTQVRFVTHRTMVDCWRFPAYLWGNLAFYLLIVSSRASIGNAAYISQSIIIGFSYWKSPNWPPKPPFRRVPCDYDVQLCNAASYPRLHPSEGPIRD
jgi:hypothetical protein